MLSNSVCKDSTYKNISKAITQFQWTFLFQGNLENIPSIQVEKIFRLKNMYKFTHDIQTKVGFTP